MSDKEIYDLELNEDINIHDLLTVMRVPGGWIYYRHDEQIGGTWSTSSVFVPFNDEFAPKVELEPKD